MPNLRLCEPLKTLIESEPKTVNSSCSRLYQESPPSPARPPCANVTDGMPLASVPFGRPKSAARL